jgi:phosphocarrier protein HPr
MSATGKATIRNEAGIHCRPSAFIVKELKDYPGTMRIWNGDGESDVRSMLGLMMMAMTCGSDVSVEVSGPDESAQLQKLTALLEKIYDFPPQD